jgi:hypothetical protein
MKKYLRRDPEVMTVSVEPSIPPLASTLLLFVGMLLMLETGRRLGIARRRQETDADRSNLGTIEGALFAVFGLLMALTFTGATSRFNEKRMFIAQEVNATDRISATGTAAHGAKACASGAVPAVCRLAARGLSQDAGYPGS